MNRLDPVSPGELLLKEFLKPMGIIEHRLARDIDVPAQDERMQLDGTLGYKRTADG